MTRRSLLVALTLISVFILTSMMAVDAQTSTPQPNEIIYTVNPGDTLFRIAVRNRTTVTELARINGIVNPALIYAGQRLRIPVSGTTAATPTPVTPPTATPQPEATSTYTVVRGDTLFRIAVRFRTTVARLVALNRLSNPSLIYVGQVLTIPSGEPVTTAVQSPTQDFQQGGGAAGFGFDFGVEAFTSGQDVNNLAIQVADLGVSWVKIPVLWQDIEPVQGQADFSSLDAVVVALRAQNVRLLLSVSTSPAWARTSTDESGPPDDFAAFGAFVSALAGHYRGQVEAYEIWNEPNLRREWNSTVHSIDARSYAALLREGYTAVKAADPAALVVSAGLAPTGFNDGVNALNDRLFLSNLYANGLAEISDAVGAHPSGWANPPDALCCTPAAGVETHYQDPSFYFLSTLNDYRQIMVNNNDGSTAIWVTKFGWGTSEDTDPPGENNIFVSYTSLEEQARYTQRGFALGSELGFVGPMFLYNLNGCRAQAGGVTACYYSLFAPNGAPRPVHESVRSVRFAPSAELPTPPVLETLEPTAESFAPLATATEDLSLFPPLETEESPDSAEMGLMEPPTPDEMLPLLPEETPEASG